MADKKVPFSQAHIQLSPDHLGLIEKVKTKVGGRVRVVLYGTLKGLSKEQSDRSEEGASAGSLDIDVSNVRYSSNNDIADLFDEEFDA